MTCTFVKGMLLIFGFTTNPYLVIMGITPAKNASKILVCRNVMVH